MGSILGIISKVTAIPAVAGLIQRLTSKLLGNQGVEAKVTAVALPTLILLVVKFVLSIVDPGLGAVVEAQEANLLAGAVGVGAIVAYYTENE